MKKQEISNYFSQLAKKSHKKSPRSKAFYQMMKKKSDEAKLRKKELSTGK